MIYSEFITVKYKGIFFLNSKLSSSIFHSGSPLFPFTYAKQNNNSWKLKVGIIQFPNIIRAEL